MANERLTVDEVADLFHLEPWQRKTLDNLLNSDEPGLFASSHAAARADRHRFIEMLDLMRLLDEAERTFPPVTVGTFTVS